MCAPHPIKPIGAEEYVPPNPRNAAREWRRVKAKRNALAISIADKYSCGETPPEWMCQEFIRTKQEARRAELRLRAVRKATSNKKEAV